MDRHGVTIRLVVKTTPSEQWRVGRALRERIKAAFEEAGIEIPVPAADRLAPQRRRPAGAARACAGAG